MERTAGSHLTTHPNSQSPYFQRCAFQQMACSVSSCAQNPHHHEAAFRESAHGLKRFRERNQQCASSIGNVCQKIQVLMIPIVPLLSRNGKCGLRFIILISLKQVHYRPKCGQKATLPISLVCLLQRLAFRFQIISSQGFSYLLQ